MRSLSLLALGLTAAVFELRRTNATTPDPTNPAATINVGETRTTGLELGLGRAPEAGSGARGNGREVE